MLGGALEKWCHSHALPKVHTFIHIFIPIQMCIKQMCIKLLQPRLLLGGVPVEVISHFPGEKEVLFTPHTKLKFTAGPMKVTKKSPIGKKIPNFPSHAPYIWYVKASV